MPVNLFQRIYIANNDSVTNLSNGHALGSGPDYLVHQLEHLDRRDTQSGSIIRPASAVTITTSTSGDIYFLTEGHERMNIQLYLTDADAADAVRSTDLWFWHLNHGFTADGISHLK